jgi:hypothetical protein
MSPSVKLAILIAVPTLLVGLVVGFLFGRFTLEREWAKPVSVLSPDAAKRLAVEGADPVPSAGSKLLKAMPIQKARAAIRELTKDDPVRLEVGSVGRSGDEGQELHLTLASSWDCEITSYEGIAYGFDAWGRAAKMNKSGEHFVAFTSKAGDTPESPAKIAPKENVQYALGIRHAEIASIALAQVDKVSCAGGRTWTRQ